VQHTFSIARTHTGRLWLHLVLFASTFITTTFAGAMLSGVDPLTSPSSIASGFPFSLTLMAILLCHEMGHYLTARYHNVPASLPYFIPAPTFIGTFGAFIRMQSQPRNRKALFDVAAAGPLAGLLLAVPAVVIGLHFSTVDTQPKPGEGVTLGSSLLLSLLSKLTLGWLPDEANITIHPIGFAGWIGFFVTAMNLCLLGS
jgi:membrane-associated protease RseP (regulator of RpoE activity)